MSLPTFTPARWAVSLIFAANGFLYANWIARLPRIQEMYGLDHGATGILLLTMSIGAFVSMPLTGLVIVRVGSQRLTMLMGLLFCVLHPALGYMPTAWAVGFVGFFIGAASGSLDVSMNAQGILVEDRLKKPVMSSFHAFFSGGMMLGASTSALMVALRLDVGPHLSIVTAVALMAIIWSNRQLLPDRPVRTEKQDQDEQRGWKLHPTLLLLGVIAFCSMLGESAMADWSTNYLERVTNASRVLAPLGLAAFSGAMTTGRVLGDYTRLRFGDDALLSGGALLALFGLGLGLLFPYPLVAIAGFFLVGIGLSTIVPIVYSNAGKVPGLAPGLGISMASTIGYAGFLIGPPVIGFLSDWLGLRFGLGFVAFLFLVLVGLAQYRRRRTAVRQPQPTAAGLSPVS